MRSLPLWSTTPLSQDMSPGSSTTTTSQRPLKFSSTSPPATAGPRTCMTRGSVTTPSAERSLHHCSLRIEKKHVPTSASSTESLIASKSPGILIATEKPESKMRRNSISDAASSSQARLQDAYFGGVMDTATGKTVATKEESGDVDLSESLGVKKK